MPWGPLPLFRTKSYTYVFRIGCFLLLLHLGVNVGMEKVFFMGRSLGIGKMARAAKAIPCLLARLGLGQHEPIGCFEHDMAAVQALGV